MANKKETFTSYGSFDGRDPHQDWQRLLADPEPQTEYARLTQAIQSKIDQMLKNGWFISFLDVETIFLSLRGWRNLFEGAKSFKTILMNQRLTEKL